MTSAASLIAKHLEQRNRSESPLARIAVEALAVLADVKPAARFTADRADAAVMRVYLAEAGLQSAEFEPTPEEWGYRHATPEERLARSRRDVRVYYAASAERLHAAIDAQERRDDDGLGQALGYPSCCIGANEVLGRMPIADMVRVARMDSRADWRLNIFLTEMDYGKGSPYYLISHFPCYLGCAQSAAYAGAVLDALRPEAPGFVADLEHLLHLSVLLRDERDPPEHRRYGNFGALLHGIAEGERVFYSGWRSLRGVDDLADAQLAEGDMLERSEAAILVKCTSTDETVARLGADRWHLVTF